MELPAVMYDPSDWYWFAGKDETLVYASARKRFVAMDDPEFLAWKEKTGLPPSHQQSEGSLWDYLAEHAPDCLPDTQTARDKKAEAETARMDPAVKKALADMETRVSALEASERSR